MKLQSLIWNLRFLLDNYRINRSESQDNSGSRPWIWFALEFSLLIKEKSGKNKIT
jgi:hypothetical protein